MGAFHMAHQTGLPLVPVVLHGAAALNPYGKLWAQPGVVTVEIHPPRDSAGWEKAKLRSIASGLHDEYQAWLDAGPTQPGQRAY
jgi:putative phosphoserine phosphatase/1-acylglycerol-3-phosphate O-acyltransferase